MNNATTKIIDPELSITQRYIAEECDRIKAMLLDKNRKYGNSAIAPKRLFSKSSAIEQLNVRIDDKLSRIASGQGDDTEDAELDLIGYLVLKRVVKQIRDEASKQKAASVTPAHGAAINIPNHATFV